VHDRPRTATREHESRFRYAAEGFDRAHLQRIDPCWQAEARGSDQAHALIVWNDRSAVIEDRALRLPLRGLIDLAEPLFLGIEQGRPLFALDLSDMQRTQVEALLHGGRLDELRRIGPLLSYADAGVLAYARALCHWHRTQLHCGRCGRPTRVERAGHQRVCTGPDCACVHFPRTDPAIIVLVEHPDDDAAGPRCLLGRSARFPERMFSTLAGFVEPGETLEQAVAREVFEESGIELDRIRYFGSQAWPFPASLMIGFHARARTTAIRLEDDEIIEADWFTPEALDAAGEWGDAAELCLPRRDSIARALIEDWRGRVRSAGGPASGWTED